MVGACRMLRLPTLRGKSPDLAEQAAREQMAYFALLAQLLLAECRSDGNRPSTCGDCTSRASSSGWTGDLNETARWSG